MAQLGDTTIDGNLVINGDIAVFGAIVDDSVSTAGVDVLQVEYDSASTTLTIQ